MRANLKQKGPVLGERLYSNIKVARHSFVTVTTYDSLGGVGLGSEYSPETTIGAVHGKYTLNNVQTDVALSSLVCLRCLLC
jgi:hypothetical protein